jgi:hypothetical protein
MFCMIVGLGRRVPGLTPVLAILGVVLLAAEFLRDRRSYRKLKQVRAGERWPLGERYPVEVDARCNGSRVWHDLEIGEDVLAFHPLNGEGPFGDTLPDDLRIASRDVTAIRVRSTWIEIESTAGRLRLVPRSYADRERLLWELAVRCNAAMERGIDEAAGAERARTEALKPAPAATVSHDAPRPASTDSANLDGLDRGMSSLGSALAGPARRPNPAPPRKSGLGNGLFVVPGGDAE